MITFSIDRSTGIRTARFSGLVNDEELLAAYDALLAAADYDPKLNDLVDLRQVERLDVTAHALRQLMGKLSRFDDRAQGARLAIVAASDVAFGMSRMYESFRGDAGPRRIQIVRTYAEAAAWLEAEPEAPRPASSPPAPG